MPVAPSRLPPQASTLPDGRLHLHHGPIDLVVQAEGAADAVHAAQEALRQWFGGVLEELCAELRALRSQAMAGRPILAGPVARRMESAVMPYAGTQFITPMAAVAGAVADAALAVLCQAAPLHRAFVNNGGDIALRLAPGARCTVGLIDRPDRPGLFARTEIGHGDGIGGIATSGWPGRSFSLGIADAVTICAATAAEADAAATVVANAVDLPGHPAVHRVPARQLQPDSDLGDILVTRGVAPLPPGDAARALEAGQVVAAGLLRSGRIVAAALHCQGETCAVP